MSNLCWYFFLGIVVSFIGSIPVGAINLNVVKTSLSGGFRPALFFSLGAAVVEYIYSFIAVESIRIVPDLSHYRNWFNMGAIPFFVVLGILTWKTKQPHSDRKIGDKKSFYSGLLVSALNPLQIPFWIVWNNYFLENGWLMRNFYLLNIYVFGTALGALLFLSILSYIAGKYRIQPGPKLSWMNKGMGLFFILLGCFQAFKVFYW